jgi:hypothetical protein
MAKSDAAVWLRVAEKCANGGALYSELAGDRCSGSTWSRLQDNAAEAFGYDIVGAAPDVQVLAACLLAAMSEAGDG